MEDALVIIVFMVFLFMSFFLYTGEPDMHDAIVKFVMKCANN